ncbi:MAG: hypothetical protein WCO33_03470 [bacterium]
MEQKEFIKSFVEKSSLSEKDSKLLFMEMESDLDSKEKDLILNGETNIMERIEKDFGDVNPISEQMFMAHHRYINIPILGPLLYFKAFRWALLLSLLIPFGYLVVVFFKSLINNEDILNMGNFFPEGIIFSLIYIFVGILYLYKKISLKQVVLNSVIFLLMILLFLYFSSVFVEENAIGFLTSPSTSALIQSLFQAPILWIIFSQIFLFAFTLIFKKVLKK